MALVAPGVAAHFTSAGAKTIAVSVDFLSADVSLAQARIQYLQTEITALEQEITLADFSVGGVGEIRQTLDQLRQQLSLLQKITSEISRDIPATNES